MKVIQVSDIHLVPDSKLLFDLNPVTRFRECISHINTHHADAALVVITGDLTHDGDEPSYRILAECLQDLRVPVQLLLGNHDDRDAFRHVFPDHPVDEHGFIQHTYDSGNARLIFLDTKEPGTHEGRLCERRLKWLDNKLEETGSRQAYLFSHHPPFELDLPSMDWIRLREEADLRTLVQKHRNVRHMFSGHVHRPSGGTWYGTPFATVPGTNHQHALDFTLTGPATTSLEPPSYAVLSLREQGVVVHYHAFMDKSKLFPYYG